MLSLLRGSRRVDTTIQPPESLKQAPNASVAACETGNLLSNVPRQAERPFSVCHLKGFPSEQLVQDKLVANAHHKKIRFNLSIRRSAPQKAHKAAAKLKEILVDRGSPSADLAGKPGIAKDEELAAKPRLESRLLVSRASKKEVKIIKSQFETPKRAKALIQALKTVDKSSVPKEAAPSETPRGFCLSQLDGAFDTKTPSAPEEGSTDESNPTNVIDLVTGAALGKLLGQILETAGLFDLLASYSGSLIEHTKEHHQLIGIVPKDRISAWSYWWGCEIAIPAASLEHLKSVKVISAVVLQVLTAIATASGMVEFIPLIGYLGTYLDLEWKAVVAENHGEGVVIAATWALPMVFVPRPWDFDDCVKV